MWAPYYTKSGESYTGTLGCRTEQHSRSWRNSYQVIRLSRDAEGAQKTTVDPGLLV